MIRRLLCASALLAALVGTAWGADYVDGRKPGTAARANAIGGFTTADTTFKWGVMSSGGAFYATEYAPLNTLHDFIQDVYADTISTQGRTLDSTGVISTIGTISVANCRFLTLGLKTEGVTGAAGGLVRVGVTAIFSHSASANDTITSYAGRPFTTLSSLTAGQPVDSVGAGTDGAATSTAGGTAIVTYQNPGFEYVRFKFRALSQPTLVGTTPKGYKLRVSIGGRAL